MELRQLRYFDAVARHLHFTRAAREMLVAQPALSLQIQQLEAELGTQLFDRTTRRVWLTDAGRELLPSAQRILAEADDARARLRDLGQLSGGRVALGAQQSLNASGVVPRVLVEFQALHPGIDVVLREESVADSLALVAEGELDLTLAMVADEWADGELVAEPLFDEPLALVVGPGHPLAGAEAVELTQLLTEPFIAFNQTAGLRRLLVRACADAGFQPRIAFESTSLGSIRALASAGLGVALLPLPSVEVEGPPVTRLPIDRDLRRTISLVRAARRYRSAAAVAFADLVRARLGTPAQAAPAP
ncbi:MAG TPA: LysR substrate-binding domain-containing protein [Capillimicrobium sp.]